MSAADNQHSRTASTHDGELNAGATKGDGLRAGWTPAIAEDEPPGLAAMQATRTLRGNAALVALKSGYAKVRRFEGALIALIIMCIYLSLTQPFFLTKANIFNILSGNADLLLISIGLTFVILSSGFDLSVGPMIGASGLVIYELSSHGLSINLSILVSVVAALAFGGLVNGVLIGVFKLNFFVVTLGTMSLLTGLVAVVTTGQTKLITATGFFSRIGNGYLLGVPNPIWVCVVTIAAAAFVLWLTPFGRAVYAVGGNREAARLAGINVTLVLILVYAIAGLCAGLAGLVDASRLAALSPDEGTNLALVGGAAVLLGGTSFFGGIGGIAGTIVGVILIGVLQNGLGLIGVSSYWQSVVTGGVLIAAVAIDRARNRGRATRRIRRPRPQVPGK